MSRLNLDQLLSLAGVRTPASTEQEKTAAPADFAKLAQRCRQAAQTTDSVAAEQFLAEKTAMVAVIGRTLAEIDAIAGDEVLEKVAGGVKPEAFIKAALEAGHNPAHIASFMK